MWVCVLCHFPCVFDDVVIGTARSGLCICLLCFLRETQTEKRMGPKQRRELIALMGEVA